MKYILQTERLSLREFNEADAAFIVELVNTDGWIKNVGDKNIKTEERAKDYLLDGPIKSYAKNGYGLCLVELRNEKIPIGMCGIINRETLDNPDIGFAFLPNFTRKGYGFEIAEATLDHAKNNLKIDRVLAITIVQNAASIKLLEKLGFSYYKPITIQHDGAELMLFSKD